jgi:hypothetical protein
MHRRSKSSATDEGAKRYAGVSASGTLARATAVGSQLA